MEAREVMKQDSQGEPTAYQDRTEDELEQVVSQLEQGEPEENHTAGSFVERVDGEIRDEVGATNHFEAPIRSLNNPETDSFVTEDGRELQIVGEEFGQLNNVFSEYADIGNIQYWVAAEPGTFSEEDWNGGGEHIADGDAHDVQAYAVRVDGEFRTAEEIDEIMEDMNIRQANNLFGGMEVPGLMVQYENVEEAVSNEDITEEEFHDQYSKARKTGLVTEDGDLTLKGMLRAVDMEAQDLDSLEAVDGDSDSIIFRSLDHENFPYLERSDVIEHDASVAVDPDSRNFDTQRTRGRVSRNEPEGQLAEQLEYLEEVFGFSVEDLAEMQEEDYSMTLAEYRREILGEETGSRMNLNEIDESEAADIAENLGRLEGGVISVSREGSLELEVEQGELDEWASVLGYTEDDLAHELAENTEFALEDGSVETEYQGDRDGMADPIESFSSNIKGYDFDDDKPVGSFSDRNSLNEVYLSLLPHRDSLEDRVDFKDSSGRVFLNKINKYDSLDRDVKQTLNELEEQGKIDTEVKFSKWKGDLQIDAEDPIRYREAIQELEEIDGIDFTEKNERVKERVKTDLGYVKTRVKSNVEDEEMIKDELEGFLDEVQEQGLTKFVHEEVEVKEYDKFGNNDLKHRVNEVLDEIDNRYLTEAARLFVDEPEMVEDDRHSHIYSEMEGTLREYEVEDRHDRPSEELLEKLGELYDKGVIEAEREIEEPYDDFEWRDSSYPDPTENINLDNYGELSEEEKDKLRELDDRGLVNLEEPSKYLEVDVNYSETDNLRLRVSGDYRVEEVDMEEAEMDISVEYAPGDDFVYEANDEIMKMAENLDPTDMQEQSFGEIEMETEFDYNKATA